MNLPENIEKEAFKLVLSGSKGPSAGLTYPLKPSAAAACTRPKSIPTARSFTTI